LNVNRDPSLPVYLAPPPLTSTNPVGGLLPWGILSCITHFGLCLTLDPWENKWKKTALLPERKYMAAGALLEHPKESVLYLSGGMAKHELFPQMNETEPQNTTEECLTLCPRLEMETILNYNGSDSQRCQQCEIFGDSDDDCFNFLCEITDNVYPGCRCISDVLGLCDRPGMTWEGCVASDDQRLYSIVFSARRGRRGRGRAPPLPLIAQRSRESRSLKNLWPTDSSVVVVNGTKVNECTDLPIPLAGHCVTALNSTHVFIVGGVTYVINELICLFTSIQLQSFL